MILTVTPTGTLRCLYQEVLDLDSLGPSSTIRASNVEPARDGWYADMGPSGGPVLGPFRLRSLALAAEVKWLEEHAL